MRGKKKLSLYDKIKNIYILNNKKVTTVIILPVKCIELNNKKNIAVL